MSWLLPVEQGVAAWAALDRDAKTLKADGDPRTLSQLRADLLVQRLTGQTDAESVPVEIHLVMTPDSLLVGDETPAHLGSAGPIPASLARRLATNRNADVFIRRLFTEPICNTAEHVDPRRRLFIDALKRLIVARDGTCRMPSCTAPIRHLDHVQRHSDGGDTTAANGQGLCERHSYTKELPGWHTAVVSTSPHITQVTTPTGHTYQSRAPSALGP